MPGVHSAISIHISRVSLLTTPVSKMYVQQLETYKHDIAERLGCFARIVDEVLYDDPDAHELLMSCQGKANAVRMTYTVIDHCLQSEKRAERFLKVLQETNPYLYAELTKCGPRGKFGKHRTQT